ncbi:MAG: choice-of-anchor P family protein [Actinomycetota bacterium]
MRRLLMPVALVALLAAFPVRSSGAPVLPEAQARAWAVRISVSSTPAVLGLVEASAQNGAVAGASGAPISVLGQIPVQAVASRAKPDDVQNPLVWKDETGSMTVEGIFAEAHSTDASSSAKTGFGSQAGSSFPMASMLSTTEQQKQLFDQWIAMNKMVFDPLNEQMAALKPILAPLGLKPPQFEAVGPMGLIDVESSRQVVASAETTSSEYLASARSSATLDEIRLFGGFIEARGISAEAVSARGMSDTREAMARVNSLKVAGIEVAVDSGGLRVAGNDQVSRALVQPVLDAVLGALDSAGVKLRVMEASGGQAPPQASALEVEIASPEGTILVSIAHVEANSDPIKPSSAESSATGSTVETPPGAPSSPVLWEGPDVSGSGGLLAPGAGAVPGARSLMTGTLKRTSVRTPFAVWLLVPVGLGFATLVLMALSDPGEIPVEHRGALAALMRLQARSGT